MLSLLFYKFRAGEVAQWLNALATLPEDPGSTPSLQLQFQGTRCPLWPPRVPVTGVVQTCQQAKHQNKNLFKIKI